MGVVYGNYQGIGATVGCSPNRVLRFLPGVLTLILFALTGCAMDKEGKVRAQLGNWVVLGDTAFFKSGWDCTAGVFDVTSDSIKNRIVSVNDTDRGLRLIASGKPVAFEIAGKTPDQVHRALDKTDHATGTAILISVLAAKECFGDELAVSYLQMLNTGSAVLMFDPPNAAVAVFDRAENRIFYGRGTL